MSQDSMFVCLFKKYDCVLKYLIGIPIKSFKHINVIIIFCGIVKIQVYSFQNYHFQIIMRGGWGKKLNILIFSYIINLVLDWNENKIMWHYKCNWRAII